MNLLKKNYFCVVVMNMVHCIECKDEYYVHKIILLLNSFKLNKLNILWIIW